MNDEELDELLQAAARDYNVPPALAPREAMWEGIAAARAEARAAARIGAPRERHLRWSVVGIAAGLLLAAGISIGRWSRAAVPVQPATSMAQSNAREVRDSVRANIGTVPSTGLSTESSPGASAAPSLAYRLVVLQHLAGSEAMITAFRASARGGQVDPQIGTWSRELLSTTRLLEASQGSSDPVMTRLLEDLDLIISQIVQYTAAGAANHEELDLIEQSIARRGVITKLRSTIPDRPLTAGL